MTIIHMYAVVDNETNQVLGKFVRPFAPPKMQNINYTLTLPDGTEVQGTAFLSKAQKFWTSVQDPLYSAVTVRHIDLVLEGFI